jgi:hypothetical protein
MKKLRTQLMETQAWLEARLKGQKLPKGDNTHAAGLQRFITGVQRLPQLLVLRDQSRRFRQLTVT